MVGAVIRIKFLSASDGGRVRAPALIGGWYRPHFRVGIAGEYLGVAFVGGPPGEVKPDIEFEATVALIYDVDYSALAPGAQFDVLEGPRTIATGVVLRRFEDERDWRTTT